MGKNVTLILFSLFSCFVSKSQSVKDPRIIKAGAYTLISYSSLNSMKLFKNGIPHIEVNSILRFSHRGQASIKVSEKGYYLANSKEGNESKLDTLYKSINDFNKRQASEKIYIQIDKPFYFIGDTLYFKSYLFDAAYLKASQRSGILYVEIANDSNRVIKRIMTPVNQGIGAAQIPLNELEMPSGAYILRAYTNWMRNSGEMYLFKKPFIIQDNKSSNWLINYQTQLKKEAINNQLLVSLKLQNLDLTPLRSQQFNFKLLDEKKIIEKAQYQTNADGLVDINISLKDKIDTKQLRLSVEAENLKAQKFDIQFPLNINRPEHIDMQFMPEGGNLISGIPTKVAFKALNEDGLGTNITGRIMNSKEQEISLFNSSYKGMGSFNLKPELGERYYAEVNLVDGQKKIFPLPLVKNSGLSLNINNRLDSDSCEIIIRASQDLIGLGKIYYLLAQARGVACYGSSFHLRTGIIKVQIAKNLFPTGIVRFTLMDQNKIALNERITYIDHQDNLKISTGLNKASYLARDSVMLQIKVTDKDDSPVKGSFSVAVTDNSQVKLDSLSEFTITNQILLASDLKGNIETPDYYFQNIKTAKGWQDLDYLLLTQGWVGFNWESIFAPPQKPKYGNELEYLIRGKVTNALSKPIAGSAVNILSKKPFIVKETITDSLGQFIFKDLFPIDIAAFFIQARNKKYKSFNVGIEMEEFTAPMFTPYTPHQYKPWNVNTDSLSWEPIQKRITLKALQQKASGINLKEVVVTAKKIIKGSKNLNGPGEADIIIDKIELEKAGKMNLEDLLKKRVPGFRLKGMKNGEWLYYINDQQVHLIIDGIDTEYFWDGITPLQQYFKEFFNYYNAEEIVGVEVMTTQSVRYTSTYLDPKAVFFNHAFIEVTTRGGSGPFLKKSAGTYIYKPMPFTVTKSFYSPKYKVRNADGTLDIRSTIFWEPNITTNKDGIAFLKFFTSDVKGTYSIKIEGTDFNGNLGFKKGSLVVK